jgi:methylenetetrahydrofolate reductase (NADPH)
MGWIEAPVSTTPAIEAESQRALIQALKRPRYEILPLDGVEDAVVRHVASEVKLTITASPSRGLDATLELAERLRRRGYDVVPHLSARLIRDRTHLEQVIARLHAADVREVFVIAGDAKVEAGDFPGAADLLSGIVELGAGFTEIGISGYPESHHLISDETTIAAMFEKEPMATYIVSQICLDADVIMTWVHRVRDRGTHLPIWIGVPGVISNRRLLRISMKIGLGESTRFLRAHRGWLARLARPRLHTPTDLVQELGPAIADPAARIGGLHLYTFNELERTESWRRQLVDRLTAENDEEGGNPLGTGE